MLFSVLERERLAVHILQIKQKHEIKGGHMKGESRQREESRLNMAVRLNQTMRAEREKEQERSHPLREAAQAKRLRDQHSPED